MYIILAIAKVIKEKKEGKDNFKRLIIWPKKLTIVQRECEIFTNMYRACANAMLDLKSLGKRKLRRQNQICFKSSDSVRYSKKMVQFKEKSKFLVPQLSETRHKALYIGTKHKQHTGSVGCYYEYLHRIAFGADLVISVTALVRYRSRTPMPTQSFYI